MIFFFLSWCVFGERFNLRNLVWVKWIKMRISFRDYGSKKKKKKKEGPHLGSGKWTWARGMRLTKSHQLSQNGGAMEEKLLVLTSMCRGPLSWTPIGTRTQFSCFIHLKKLQFKAFFREILVFRSLRMQVYKTFRHQRTRTTNSAEARLSPRGGDMRLVSPQEQ